MKIGNIGALTFLALVVVLSVSGQLSAATLISTGQSEDCVGEGCVQPALYTVSAVSGCAASAQGSTGLDCAPQQQGLMYVNQTAYAAEKDSDDASSQADEKLSIPGSFLASVLAIIGIVAVARRDVSQRGGDGNE